LTQQQIEKLLAKETIGKLHKSRILEALGISGYHHRTGVPVISILIADDAPQFITKYLQLCRVHAGRHYKRLLPVFTRHRQILAVFSDDFWGFYHKLLEFKKNPNQKEADLPDAKFDKLLSAETEYTALTDRIAKTKDNKPELLLVLRFPFLLLHNNPAELGARRPVRRRDISRQTKSEKGTLVQDTFLTIVETAKKLDVNIHDFLFDRVSKKNALPSLAEVIREKAERKSEVNSPPMTFNNNPQRDINTATSLPL